MPNKKEILEESGVVVLHVAGKGYRVIPKNLDNHQSTV